MLLNQQILNHRQNDKNVQEQIDRINRQREADRKELDSYQEKKKCTESGCNFNFRCTGGGKKEKAADWMRISMRVRIR